MSRKTNFLESMKNLSNIKTSFMIMKIIFKDNTKLVCLLSDKTGSIKATFANPKVKLEVGYVVEVDANMDTNLEINSFEVLDEYELSDYLPTLQRDINEVMKEIEDMSSSYILSREAKELNNYFFKDEEFLKKFKQCIGGVSMHHNYIGGLAEHTLNVMYLTTILCDRYDCRHSEIAVLSAKLHDIGKILEFNFNGPFKYSIRGELEGHITIGVQMIDEAVRSKPNFYSEDFINRVKGCIVQHHGKIEYGSPKNANMEESIIVNFADSIDARMNKLYQLKEIFEVNSWSEYDRALETRIYF